MSEEFFWGVMDVCVGIGLLLVGGTFSINGVLSLINYWSGSQ